MISSLLTNMMVNQIQISRKIIQDDPSGDCYALVYDGEGEVLFVDGGKYEGSMVNGFLHGPGKYTWSDGTSIKMNFNKNNFTGNAT